MRTAAVAAAYCFTMVAPFAFAQDLKRSDINDKIWLEGSIGVSPDSGVFHGEGSAVADRRDVSVRYQHGALGLLVNRHTLDFDAELEQEAYKVKNTVYGAGISLRLSPFDEKGGFWGGSHIVAYVMGQTGRSDYHYSEGPSGGAKNEVKADIVKASGFSSGADFYFPAIYGLWLHAGGGWETNNFAYKIDTDPNNDGRVNIRQWFNYLRAGLSFSF